MTTAEPAPLPAGRVAEAAALWTLCGLTRPWNDAQADARLALAGPASTLLAVDEAGGALAGTALVGFDGHRAWVYYLAVRPDLRRGGLGARLMRAAEAWAAARGAPKLELMVREGAEATLGFYAALGYRREPVTVLSRWIDGRPDAPTDPVRPPGSP